jgi:uncharacterized membrane protein HdeD (DUF308 family)
LNYYKLRLQTIFVIYPAHHFKLLAIREQNKILYLCDKKKAMETRLFNSWSLLAINGVIAILFGVMALFIPGTLLLTLVTYFGIVILLLGISMLVGVILNIKNDLPYGVDLVESIIILAIGVLFTFYTKTSLEVFVIVIGSWALLIGAGQLFFAFKINPELSSKNTLLVNGAISLIFGFILFFNPFEAAAFLLVISGILSLVMGTILIVIALKMKNFTI